MYCNTPAPGNIPVGLTAANFGACNNRHRQHQRHTFAWGGFGRCPLPKVRRVREGGGRQQKRPSMFRTRHLCIPAEEISYVVSVWQYHGHSHSHMLLSLSVLHLHTWLQPTCNNRSISTGSKVILTGTRYQVVIKCKKYFLHKRLFLVFLTLSCTILCNSRAFRSIERSGVSGNTHQSTLPQQRKAKEPRELLLNPKQLPAI
jgi:hypothetical protein